MKHKLKALQRTCEAFPAQWEGVTYDGKFVYIRYRYGCLQLSVANTEDAAVRGSAAFSDSVFIEYGHDMQGNLKLTDLMRLSKDFFNFNGCAVLEDDVKFYIYTVPAEKLSSDEYSPSFNVTSIRPLQLGEQVEPEPGAQEITADKHKFIVDPNRVLFNLIEEGVDGAN